MNRRNFIASLIAIPAAIKAATIARSEPPDKVLGLTHPRLDVPWIQTTRIASIRSIEYDDEIVRIITNSPRMDFFPGQSLFTRSEVIASAIARAKRKFDRQLLTAPLPLP